MTGIIIGENNITGISTKLYKSYSLLYTFYHKKTNKIKIDEITLQIDESSFEKIAKKRNNSLNNGFSTKNKDDYSPVKILFDDEILIGKIKLKGDLTDHFSDEKKWSFRIKLKKNNFYKKLRNFSIQHPKTRNYLNEWVFHKFIKYENLISLNYDFIKVKLNNKNLGIYAMEEGFDSQFLKNRSLADGPIVKFDEGDFFKNWYSIKKINNGSNKFFQAYSYNEYQNSNIKSYSSKKKLTDSIFRSYLETAKYLLEKFKRNEIKASKVFDVDKMARYLASIDLFSAHHGLSWNNMRFYYNIESCRLEPIAFDLNATYNEATTLNNSKKIENGMIMNKHFKIDKMLFDDTLFVKGYMKELKKYTSKKYIDDFFKSINEELAEKKQILSMEYSDYNDSYNLIYKKANFILESLRNCYLNNVEACIDENYILINNTNDFPVQILSVFTKNNIGYNFGDDVVLYSKIFTESPNKIKIFIPKDKYILENKKLKLKYKVFGFEEEKIISVNYISCD